MKTKRIFALLLAALMIVGLFAGCSKDGTKDPGKTDPGNSLIDQTKPSQTTAKYAYKADYFDLAVPDGVQYVNQICAAGTTLYLTASMQGEEITNTDPDTGETWSYYDSRLGVLTIDPDTGICTELSNLQLPEVPEGAEGSVNCYNMIGSDDGTLWMLVNVYATQYELPDDFDPNTDSKWNYPSTDINGSYLMHIAADGSTIANVDLSVTDDGTDEEDGMGSNISSFAVDAAGNLLVPVSEPVARHWRYQLRVPRPGDRVVLGMRHEGGMLLVDGCEAMCFEAVTVYASPCFAFYEIGHGGGGNTYRGCRLIRRPGTDRLLASAADCFHSMNQRRGPLIEQCEFSWAMDDFVNIHGYFHVVLEQLSEDELLIVTPFGTGLQPGTELTFFSAPYGREKFLSAVVSRQESAGSEQEGLRRVRELYGRKFGIGLQGFPGGSLCRVRFDRPLDTEPGDFACDYDSCGSGAVLRDNDLHDCHVRGVLLKAADCRIENNRISRTALNGIILKPEFFWLEGPMPRNIVIQGNTLTDCAFGHTALAAILVMCGCCAPPADRITPVVNAENITIAGNEIRNCNAGSGIAVFNSRHPRVSNNRIFHPFSNPAAIGRLDVSSRLDFSGKELSGEEISRLRESYSAILFLGSDAIECRHNSLTDPGRRCRMIVYAGPGCSGCGEQTDAAADHVL